MICSEDLIEKDGKQAWRNNSFSDQDSNYTLDNSMSMNKGMPIGVNTFDDSSLSIKVQQDQVIE